jgi:iron-sulfur cluster repair protein YtfE (RIC family)
MTVKTQATTVMEYLQADHRQLDGIMEACKAAAASGDLPTAAARFAEFREGLLRHIRIEEEMVFPAFEGASGLGEGGPTAVMRYEHAEIQRLLGLTAEILVGAAPDAAELESLRSALVALLHEHNVKEERILYPMTDRMLPPPQRLDLVRKIQEF